MIEKLLGYCSILGGLFLIIWKIFSSGKNIGKSEIKNEQNEIKNQQLEEQIDDIQEWKRSSDYIDSLGNTKLNVELRKWKESEKNNQS